MADHAFFNAPQTAANEEAAGDGGLCFRNVGPWRAGQLAMVAMMVPVAVLAALRRALVIAPFEIAEPARAVGIDPAVRTQAGRAADGMLAEAVMPAAMIPAVTEQAVVMTPAMRGRGGAAQRDAEQQRTQEQSKSIHVQSSLNRRRLAAMTEV